VLQYYSIAFITRTMAPPALKRARKVPTASRKRVKTSSSTAAASAAAETAVASQLPISSSNFELLFQDSQPESAIVAPNVDGSRAATEASADDNINNGGDTRIDAHLVDTYPGLDWARIPSFTKPIDLPTNRKSWVYDHGYRIALRRNLKQIYWVCHDCYRCKKVGDSLGGVYLVAEAVSAALRDLKILGIWAASKEPEPVK
jgi:hypothetical protein